MAFKAISNFDKLAKAEGEDLFFVSRKTSPLEDGSVDWRSNSISYGTIYNQIKDQLSSTYINIKEKYLTANALEYISNEWNEAYWIAQNLCSEFGEVSSDLSDHILFLSGQVDNVALSTRNLQLSVSNISAEVKNKFNEVQLSVNNLCAEIRKLGSLALSNGVVCTLAAYNALHSKSDRTLYFCYEDR